MAKAGSKAARTMTTGLSENKKVLLSKIKPRPPPETGENRYRPDDARIAYNLTLLGLNQAELAKAFGVTAMAISKWKTRYPEFGQAIADGMEFADARVARALYESAIGYEHEVTRAVVLKDRVVEVTEVIKYPPNMGSAKYWLATRQRRLWTEKVQIDSKVEHVQTHINVSDPAEAAIIYRKLISGE